MLRLILALPVVLLLISFALSNRAPVELGLWPTDLMIEMPVSVAILGGMAVSFLLGATLTWVGSLGHRRRASRAESQLKHTKAQMDDLRARMAPVPSTLARLTD